MARADLHVIGAGVFGLACAWVALQHGAHVRVYDKSGVGGGASGGIVGALAPHVPENWNAKKQFQLESLLMARGFWQEISDASGLSPGYGRLGRLQALEAGPAALARAHTRTQGAVDLWQGAAIWRVLGADMREAARLEAIAGALGPDTLPQGWYPGDGGAIVDNLSARIHPKQACVALAAAIQARGGEVICGDACDIDAQDLHVPVIWATGYEGLGVLSTDCGAHLGGGVKGQALLLRLAAEVDLANAPQLYADGLHIVPHEDGHIALGSTSENSWEAEAECDGQAMALLPRAQALCPALFGAEVIGSWAGVRPRARSRAPMLGAWPGRPGHFIANGGFKIGFGMAPKVAHVMVDLVLSGRDTIPTGFRVEDNMPKGGQAV